MRGSLFWISIRVLIRSSDTFLHEIDENYVRLPGSESAASFWMKNEERERERERETTTLVFVATRFEYFTQVPR